MKKQILFSLLGMILLISLAVGADLILSERTTTISETDKTTLSTARINNVQVTDLNCKTEYCSFWITKQNIINSERFINKHKEVCIDSSEEIANGTFYQDCTKVLKTSVELVNERNSIVDNALSIIAKDLSIIKSIDVKIGTDEKVIIKEESIIKK